MVTGIEQAPCSCAGDAREAECPGDRGAPARCHTHVKSTLDQRTSGVGAARERSGARAALRRRCAMSSPDALAPLAARLRELAAVFVRLGVTAFGGPAAHIA